MVLEFLEKYSKKNFIIINLNISSSSIRSNLISSTSHFYAYIDIASKILHTNAMTSFFSINSYHLFRNLG